MKLAIAVLAALPFVALGQESPDRVQAKEPTVVTVHGHADKVKEQKASPERKEKRSRGFISRLSAAPGWLMFANEDIIPSSRERAAAAAYRK